MADAAPAPAVVTATVVVRPHHTRRELARWSSVMLIIFMFLIPFLGKIDLSGTIIHFLKEWLFIVFIGYMSIQFWETANRSSNDAGGFFEDNGIALIAVLVGFGLFILLFTQTVQMGEDQIHILLQCLGWGGLDFVFGVVISRSIAASAKERDEK